MYRRKFDQIKYAIVPGLFLALALMMCVPAYSAELRPMDFKAIRAYDFDKSRQPLAVVEENARIASKEQLLQIEKEIDGVLEDAQASFAAKLFSCQLLRRIGTQESIPALEKCLKDQKLFDIARLGLERLSSPKVDAVLLEELKKAEGVYRIGLISSIAQRRDENAVGEIEKSLKSTDPAMVELTIKALGRIGGKKATSALKDFTTDKKNVEPLIFDSLLLCADKFLSAGEKDEALEIYKKFSAKEMPVVTRIAANHGLARALKQQEAVEMLVGLLKDENIEIREGATKEFIMGFQGTEMTEALVKQLPDVSADTQVLILKALASRKDTAAVESVMKISSSKEEKVQIAAIETLGVIGNASTVPHLAEFAGMGGAKGKAAEEAIVALRGDDVDPALKKEMSGDKAGIRAAVVRVMIQRHTKDILASLFEYAKDPAVEVRKESIKGVNSLASGKEFAAVVGLLAAAKDGEEQRLAEMAVRDIGKKVQTPAECDEIFAKILPTAPEFAKPSLMGMMSEFGGMKSCKAVEAELSAKDEKLSFAALETLAKWPDASPMNPLEELVKKENEGKIRETALRGYLHALRLATLPEKESVQKFHEALKLSKNRNEKILVIEAVSKRADVSSLDILEGYLSDPEIGKEAKGAYSSLIKALEGSEIPSNNLEVTASHNPDAAKLVLDGKKRSRWSSGGDQKPGIWFQIDLGSTTQLEKVVLDADGYSGDFPDAYKVYVTDDLSQPGKPVAEGKGTSAVTDIALNSAKGRYIRIEQTGQKSGLFWSISEIKVFKTTDPAKIQHAKDVLKKLENK